MHSDAGATTILVVMVLLFVMMLVGAFTSHTLIRDQKSSGNLYRSAQAFEAAEAGLEWGLAMLNGARVDANCNPSTSSGSTIFRRRVLQIGDATTGGYATSPGSSAVGVPACILIGGAWQCRCPATGVGNPPSTSATSASTLAPVFKVEFGGARLPGDTLAHPRTLTITSHGCSARLSGAHGARVCDDSNPAGLVANEAYAKAMIDVALLPALAALPSAALTAKGNVDLGDRAGVQNTDPSTGITINAGGDLLHADDARLSGPAGSAAAASKRGNDLQLSARADAQFMRSYLGMPSEAFAQLPGTRLPCNDTHSCTARELQQAYDGGVRMVWVADRLELSDVALGSRDDPMLLVVGDELALSGNVQLSGFVLARSLTWSGGSAGSAWLRGAAVVLGDVTLSGTSDISYDAPALQRLRVLVGTFVRIPGSWRDKDVRERL
ncbi:MAG TPA: pilus assembly PilX N-terminal domain-containing protein [Burkholderiaceae bacterium]|nr:pilus assembly PilX N-terminal domain-containing protein [Burkholderiaceae bacterium]